MPIKKRSTALYIAFLAAVLLVGGGVGIANAFSAPTEKTFTGTITRVETPDQVWDKPGEAVDLSTCLSYKCPQKVASARVTVPEGVFATGSDGVPVTYTQVPLSDQVHVGDQRLVGYTTGSPASVYFVSAENAGGQNRAGYVAGLMFIVGLFAAGLFVAGHGAARIRYGDLDVDDMAVTV